MLVAAVGYIICKRRGQECQPVKVDVVEHVLLIEFVVRYTYTIFVYLVAHDTANSYIDTN